MEKQMKKNAQARPEDNAVCQEILRCGGEILHSDMFRRASEETHHLHGTVADHSLSVCILSARIGRILQRIGFRVNKSDLIQAALCHDLGMLGRGERYRSRLESWKAHPEYSARITRRRFRDVSERATSIIRSHMWPIAGTRPRSLEAFIIRSADRLASVTDWVAFLTGKNYGERIKKELLN